MLSNFIPVALTTKYFGVLLTKTYLVFSLSYKSNSQLPANAVQAKK